MSTEQQTPVAAEEQVAKDQVEQQEPVAPATEQAVPATEQTTPVEPEATKDEVTEAKSAPVDGESAEPTSDDKPAAVDVSDNKADDKAAETVDEVKVVEPVAEAESNGNNNHSEATAENGKTQEAVEPAKEAEVETNGVCKRKAENGTETAESGDKTENSPKKVKVVNDGEQAPTEETAA